MDDRHLLEITSKGDEEDEQSAEAATTAASPPPASAPPANPTQTADGKAPITEAPYDFEQCTVTFTFTLLPAHGDACGRRVVISARPAQAGLSGQRCTRTESQPASERTGPVEAGE